MEFLGIGPLELLFVLLIALILIGPKDMVKTGRTIGRTLRKVVTSPQWQMINRTSREIRNIPNRLIREAGLEDMQHDLDNLKQATTDIQKTLLESTILPPGWTGVSTQNQTNTRSPSINPAPQKATDLPIPSDASTTVENLIIPGPEMVQSAGFSAWTTPAGSLDDPTVGANRASQSDDLSAWITPPASTQTKTRN
jgi:Sec-independent protein translocase protein TatA